MNLSSDLARLIRSQFDKHGIPYSRSLSFDRLAARYFEMMIRQIQPTPRTVHFSRETNASLGELARRGHDDGAARDAWGAVFRLREFLVEGMNVNGFLSRNIRRATGKASRDGLLRHFGMHHFHLGNESGPDGFVKRSDYLLFAIVAPRDVYFLDVRKHPVLGGVEWASQGLLRTVH